MPRNAETVDGVPCRRVAGRLWLSLDDAAEYSGYARGTLRNWGAAGKIETRRLGRRAHVAKDQLDEVLTGAAG
jgi:excisionase family DNA binding protein